MSSDHYFTSKAPDHAALGVLDVHIAGRAVRLHVAPGVFSASRLDPGTKVLLDHAGKPGKGGDLLDLGCGWGPIALTMAALRPKRTVWAVDVNERALDLVRRNAEVMDLPNIRAVLPEEVPADLQVAGLWSNPPIRIGKEALHHLLDAWLPRLAPGGEALLVVQRHLGADSLQAWLAAQNPDFFVERFASAKGYRVIKVSRLA